MVRTISENKKINKAKANLKYLKIKIGNRSFEFEKDIFDIPIYNIGGLAHQIQRIATNIAYVGEAIGEADSYLKHVEMEYSVWYSTTIHDINERSDEKKKNALIKKYKVKYLGYHHVIRDAKKLLSILKSYKDGVSAKMQLCQTLSANIRMERDAIYRNYDKPTRMEKGEYSGNLSKN